MNKAYLLTGGNQGDIAAHMQLAKGYINKKIGSIINQSSLYKTAAWGNTLQPDFLNRVLVVGSDLGASQMLSCILDIENNLGRVRNKKNDPRIIDIDILFFNDEIIQQPGLTIPHAEIPNRRFVLQPMNEIAPDLIHPVLKKTIRELLQLCKDPLDVTVFDKINTF
ncbi:2-amino-4-hydroxy-6-hydroxymethyldihydropteridinediphosphokinase [soil metagenome]